MLLGFHTAGIMGWHCGQTGRLSEFVNICGEQVTNTSFDDLSLQLQYT